VKRVNQGTKTDEALRLARKITAEIESLIVDMFENGQTLSAYNRLLELLTELDQIEGELDLSCELIGMLSPWAPQVKEGEPTLAQLDAGLVPFTPASDPDLWTWPTLRKSLDFLSEQEILSSSEWNSRVRNAESRAREQPLRIRLESQIEQFRQHLRDGLANGDSVAEFKKRVKPTIEATDSTIERNFRTSSKRAYLDGVDKVTNKKTFPFVKYVATKDNRTRPTHRAMDGRVIEVGTPEYDRAVELQREYNCRCTLIPLTDKQAEREGVKQPDLNIEFDKAEEGKVVSNSYVGRVTSHKGVIYKIAKDEAIPQEEVRLQEIASRRGLAPKVYRTEEKDGTVTKVAMENVRKTSAANLERTTGGGGVEHGTRPLQSLLELNQDGIAHRDLHGGNVRWQPSTGKVVFFDFEKATLDRDQAEWEAGQTLRGFIDYQRNRDLTTEQEQALDRLEPLIRDEVDNEGHPAWRLSTVDIPRAKELLEAWNR
jgi:SPP1 gp7 family putative phage head morphogenesis protein